MLSQHYDLGIISLYIFWLFFAGLIWHLHRENMREGHPLDTDLPDRAKAIAAQSVPKPKIFTLLHPMPEGPPREERDLTGLAVPAAGFRGAPLAPTGNPMKDGVGAAAWASRADIPDLAFDDQKPKIVPLRVATEFFIPEEDPDPRGMRVMCCDGRVGGTVVDCWVDRSEVLLRYLEADVPHGGGTRRVLFPMFLAVVDAERKEVKVDAVTAAQFADAPALRKPDEITLLEEDKVSAYFAGGKLYATAERLGPVL
jgi:photosynthetic reaction center H subunit